MDMRFHRLKDRECQQQFKFYWRPGKLNHADYWTKHHSAAHHVNVRKEFFAVSVKSNEYLYKTIITSTTPTEINTIFANYKNLYIHSTDKDDKYEENLGISEEEINNILNEDTSMNLLKTHYSSLNEETKKSWTFTEVINSIKNETSLNKDLNELNIKEILIKLLK